MATTVGDQLIEQLNIVRELWLKYSDTIIGKLRAEAERKHPEPLQPGQMTPAAVLDLLNMEVITDVLQNIQFGAALACDPETHKFNEDTMKFVAGLKTDKQREDYKAGVIGQIMYIAEIIFWPWGAFIRANEMPETDSFISLLAAAVSKKDKAHLFRVLNNVLDLVAPIAEEEDWVRYSKEEALEKAKQGSKRKAEERLSNIPKAIKN